MTRAELIKALVAMLYSEGQYDTKSIEAGVVSVGVKDFADAALHEIAPEIHERETVRRRNLSRVR